MPRSYLTFAFLALRVFQCDCSLTEEVATWTTNFIHDSNIECSYARDHLKRARFVYATTVSINSDEGAAVNDLWKGGGYAGKLIDAAVQAICSLKKTGATYPVMVLANNVPTDAYTRFKEARADILCNTSGFNASKLWHPYGGQDTQGRTDVWTIYHKFLLFNMTQHDYVISFDSDMLFQSSPDYIFDNVPDGAQLIATQEAHPSAARAGFNWGINAHFFLLRPDRMRFFRMLYRLQAGAFRAFTQGEQDVMENEYIAEDLKYWGEPGVPGIVPHIHHYDMKGELANGKFTCPELVRETAGIDAPYGGLKR